MAVVCSPGWQLWILIQPSHSRLDVSPETAEQRSLFRARYRLFTVLTVIEPGVGLRSSGHLAKPPQALWMIPRPRAPHEGRNGIRPPLRRGRMRMPAPWSAPAPADCRRQPVRRIDTSRRTPLPAPVSPPGDAGETTRISPRAGRPADRRSAGLARPARAGPLRLPRAGPHSLAARSGRAECMHHGGCGFEGAQVLRRCSPSEPEHLRDMASKMLRFFEDAHPPNLSIFERPGDSGRDRHRLLPARNPDRERITIGRHTRPASGTHERGSVRPPQTSPTRERGSVRRSARPIRPPPIRPTRERRSGVAHRAKMRPGRTDRTDRPSLARRAGIEAGRQGVRNPFVIRSRSGDSRPIAARGCRGGWRRTPAPRSWPVVFGETGRKIAIAPGRFCLQRRPPSWI